MSRRRQPSLFWGFRSPAARRSSCFRAGRTTCEQRSLLRDSRRRLVHGREVVAVVWRTWRRAGEWLCDDRPAGLYADDIEASPRCREELESGPPRLPRGRAAVRPNDAEIRKHDWGAGGGDAPRRTRPGRSVTRDLHTTLQNNRPLSCQHLRPSATPAQATSTDKKTKKTNQ